MNNRVDRANDIDNQLEDQSIRNDLDELSEDINPDIRLSEI
jgi:threonyl-tRNA synthetase